MIGGGVFTVAGVLIGNAGSLAWVSLLAGALFALVTVRSYARLALTTHQDGVPVTIVKSRALSAVLAWWLLVVYVLALAVYIFTVGHYIGRAFGLSRAAIAGVEAVFVLPLIVLNLFQLTGPVKLQVGIVWAVLVVLAALASTGFVADPFARYVPAATAGGVVRGTVLSFIAFEGFEMLAYDLRELRRPARVLAHQLPLAVIVVAVAYAAVTYGSLGLIGRHGLIDHEDNALAVAGAAAAGTPGLAIVTIAAVAAGTSAINATLFSAARLARATAERGLVPRCAARCNRHEAPDFATISIGVAGLAIAARSRIEVLIAVTSIGFLVLFAFVNALALHRRFSER